MMLPSTVWVEMAILGIYRNVDAATLLDRREALLKALAKANGRSSRQWNDGGFSVGEGYNFTALREELAEVQYEIHRRGLDDDSDGEGGKAPGGFVPVGVRPF